MTQDDLLKIIQRHVAELMEHCDTVQVFVTKHNVEEGLTMAIDRGDGNWYARYGQAREWVTQEDYRARQVIDNDDNDEYSL